MKRLLITLALLAALLALLAAPPLATAGRTRLPYTAIAQWDPNLPDGLFAKGLAIDSQGTMYVSMTKWGALLDPATQTYAPNEGQIWRVALNGDKQLVAARAITPDDGFMGVTLNGDDDLYIAIADFSGTGEGAEPSGVLHLDVNAADPTFTRVLTLPAGSFPNKLKFHEGQLYISDSALAAIWRTTVTGGDGTLEDPWLQDPLLAPAGTGPALTLGANGIAFKGDRLYVMVYDAGRIVRVSVLTDGTAGTPTVLCERPELRGGDGIAFDILGRLWVLTNGSKVTPDGGIWRVARGGSVTKIAKDPGWLNYPTTPVFGQTASTTSTLFVLNGAYYDFYGGAGPSLVSLPVGVAGL